MPSGLSVGFRPETSSPHSSLNTRSSSALNTTSTIAFSPGSTVPVGGLRTNAPSANSPPSVLGGGTGLPSSSFSISASAPPLEP